MLLLTATATADTVTEGYDTVFRACFRDSYQGEMVAKFAAEELKVKKVAVLYASGDTYSAGLYEAFKKACGTYGLDIVATESSSSTRRYGLQHPADQDRRLRCRADLRPLLLQLDRTLYRSSGQSRRL